MSSLPKIFEGNREKDFRGNRQFKQQKKIPEELCFQRDRKRDNTFKGEEQYGIRKGAEKNAYKFKNSWKVKEKVYIGNEKEEILKIRKLIQEVHHSTQTGQKRC
jgi:hypothetical protein